MLKDYDCLILYPLGETNVVAYALSRKSTGSLAQISTERTLIVKELHESIDQGLQLKVTKKCILAQFGVQSVYLNRVKVAQSRDPQLQKIRFEVQQGQSQDFMIDSEGILCLDTRLCVPDVGKLRKEIMEEAHFLLTIFIQVLIKCIIF